MIKKVDADPSEVTVLSAALPDVAMSVEVHRGGRKFLLVNDNLAIRDGNAHVAELLHMSVRAALKPLR
jgi:hypothetical protein